MHAHPSGGGYSQRLLRLTAGTFRGQMIPILTLELQLCANEGHHICLPAFLIWQSHLGLLDVLFNHELDIFLFRKADISTNWHIILLPNLLFTCRKQVVTLPSYQLLRQLRE